MLYRKSIIKSNTLARCLFSAKHQKVIFSRTKSPKPNHTNEAQQPPIFGTGYEQSQYERSTLKNDLKGTQRDTQLKGEEISEKEIQESQQELESYFQIDYNLRKNNNQDSSQSTDQSRRNQEPSDRQKEQEEEKELDLLGGKKNDAGTYIP